MSRSICAEAAAWKVVGEVCKGCAARRVGCHSSCKDYKDAMEVYRQSRDGFIAAEKQRDAVNDYVYSQRVRTAIARDGYTREK